MGREKCVEQESAKTYILRHEPALIYPPSKPVPNHKSYPNNLAQSSYKNGSEASPGQDAEHMCVGKPAGLRYFYQF